MEVKEWLNLAKEQGNLDALVIIFVRDQGHFSKLLKRFTKGIVIHNSYMNNVYNDVI